MSSREYRVVGEDSGWKERNEQAYRHQQDRTLNIYRGTDARRANDYIATGDRLHIQNVAPGDFNRRSEPAAYFAYDPRYAVAYAGNGGRVIQQTVPKSFLRGPDARVYEAEPNDEWRRRVYHDRRGDVLPGKERRDQKYQVTTGPICDTHSSHFQKATQIPPPHRYKPARDPEDGYYQQVAIKGEALDRIGQYPREIYRRSPDRNGR